MVFDRDQSDISRSYSTGPGPGKMVLRGYLTGSGYCQYTCKEQYILDFSKLCQITIS